MAQNGRQKGTLAGTIQKELRVVTSRNRSPLPLRIAKWALFLALTWRLYGTRWFLSMGFRSPARRAGHAPALSAQDAWLDEPPGWLEGCRGGKPEENIETSALEVLVGNRRRAEVVRFVSSYWRGHSSPHCKSLGSTLSAVASLRKVCG